ncbi:deaminase [Prosthecobacter sp.]|uniref:nucleoside deaminase n=1 Tax=Prosthecobacter sp. TaxID=1965333 RepID=UPI0024885D33|nr:deaminase [Prosthecobacter sp.]MDI1311786.1 deaminase [Prosthecobacter sp.]
MLNFLSHFKPIVPCLFPALLGLVGCLAHRSPAKTQTQEAASTVSRAHAHSTSRLSANAQNIAEERDALYTLLAYALVYKDWQTLDTKQGARGHNIGCVLVNPKGQIVHVALNSNGKYKNGTQHGETRVMWQYQEREKLYDLKGYTIYTTLEPCAMCSGMMVMQKVSRTVYGQTDLDFGKAVERLQLKSAQFPPYPRAKELSSTPADHPVRISIDQAYKLKYDSSKIAITEWLRSEEAKALYAEAQTQLLSNAVLYEENRAVLADCLKSLKRFEP